MIKISKFENGAYVECVGVLIGTPIHETIDETLDTGSIIIKSPTENYVKLWQSIKIEIYRNGFGFNDYSRCFLVSDINTVRLHTIEETYQHTISLIEPTKYLEKITGISKSFTNKNNWLLDQTHYAVNNAEPVEVGQTPRFRLSAGLQAFLGNTPGVDFFFEKATLREVKDGILAAKNARCEVLEITDFNNIEIDYYDMTEPGKLIPDFGEIVGKESAENIEYLGADIEAYGDNSFSGNRAPVWHPSPRGWDTFKTDEPVLNDNNAVIKVAFPIEEITKFEVPISFTLNIMKGADSHLTTVITKTLDISANVKDAETYNILENQTLADKYNWMTTDLYKENVIRYTKQSNTVEVDKIKKMLFFTTTSMENAIKNIIYKQPSILTQWLTENPVWSEYTKLDNITLVNFTSFRTMFRIKYVPYIDAHSRISKVNFDGPKSTIISNQSDKTIDLARFGDNLYGQINRLGNKQIFIDKILDNMTQAYNLGDYTNDGYVVTTRGFAFYDDFIKARYEFTKNFNPISQKISIDRKKRVYNIPLENFVRDILIKKTIKVSFDGPMDDSILIREYLKTFTSDPNIPITNALVQTVPIWPFDLPVVGYSMATSMLFKFKFMDNFSAGMASVGQVVGGVKQKPLAYVDSIGEYHQISICLFNEDLSTRSTNYSDVALLPRTQANWYENVVRHFDRTYLIDKDAYEHHQFTIQFDTVSSTPNIIIGFAIAYLNALLTTNKTSLKLYVSTTEKYSVAQNSRPKGAIISDQSIETIEVIGNMLAVWSSDLLGSNQPNIQSWGLADDKGNLIIGVNKNGDELIKTIIRFNQV